MDGIDTGTNFTYNAHNNTIYVIVVAYNNSPHINFTYRLFKEQSAVINETDDDNNNTHPNATIIVKKPVG